MLHSLRLQCPPKMYFFSLQRSSIVMSKCNTNATPKKLEMQQIGTRNVTSTSITMPFQNEYDGTEKLTD
jgi:hypothetical protein